MPIIGASVSEPPLVDSTDALSRYIYRYIDRYIDVRRVVRSPLLRMRGATRKRSRPDRESIQSMLSQHFQPAVSIIFGTMGNAVMTIWDFKREGDVLFRHLQGS